MGYVLVSARGHKQGLKIPVRPKVFLIGSSSRARVRSRKAGVGRQHCVLLRRKKKLYLQDLDCGHPTQVNGVAMAPGMRVRLSPGDRVALGPMEFVIGYERDQARAPVLLGAPYAPPRRPAAPPPRPVVSGEIAERLPEPPSDPLRGVVVLAVVALICMGGGWLLYETVFAPSGKDPAEQSQVAKRKEESSERTPQPVLPADLKKPTETASAKIVEQKADTNPTPARPPEKPPVSKLEEKPAEKPRENPKPQLVYADHVLPVLRARCLNCHGGDDPKGGLDLSTLAALQKGGNNGEAVVPGTLDKGTLWDNIQSNNMPPGRRIKLTDAEKKIIRDWILSAKDGKLARR